MMTHLNFKFEIIKFCLHNFTLVMNKRRETKTCCHGSKTCSSVPEKKNQHKLSEQPVSNFEAEIMFSL